jgi:hypothetical protein
LRRSFYINTGQGAPGSFMKAMEELQFVTQPFALNLEEWTFHANQFRGAGFDKRRSKRYILVRGRWLDIMRAAHPGA